MFEWLEHACTTHDPGVLDMLIDPFLRACKDDPRFIAFAQKIGVMPKPVAQPMSDRSHRERQFDPKRHIDKDAENTDAERQRRRRASPVIWWGRSR